MKKLFFILALLACALLSCNKDKDEIDKPDDPKQPETPGTTLSLSTQDLVFEAAGGWKEFTINCSGAWTLTGDNAWCQLGMTSSSGKAQIKVWVEASTLTSDRNVNLTVRSGSQVKVLAVTQKGVNALTLTKDKFDLSAEGGDLTVTLQANVECTSAIPAAFQSWIKKAPGTKAMTSQSFRFTVSPNESTDKREGYIVFNGGSLKDTIRVYQTGKTPAEESQLILSNDTYDLSAEAQEITVELQTNIDYEISVPDSVSDWVHHVDTRALRTDRVRFSIDKNEGWNVRSAVVIIREQGGALTDTLQIRQKISDNYKDITDEFDPDFARVLEEKKYIKDATHITRGEVNTITDIRVGDSQLTSLQGIEYFTELKLLLCTNNQLSALDISKNTRLEHLYCAENQLSALDVSRNTELTRLDCYNNRLVTLDVSKCTALETLYCYNNPGDGNVFLLTASFNENNMPELLMEGWAYDNKYIVLQITTK